MKDELERYKRILEEWGAGNEAPPKTAPPGPPPRMENPQPVASNQPERGRAKLATAQPAAETGRYPGGTILCLDDSELVVYRRPVKDQPYDMVYSLLSDGSIKIEAVEFSKHKIDELGLLNADEVKSLQTQMRWTRSLISNRCKNPVDAERIPEPASDAQGAPQTPRQAPPPPPPPPDQPLRPVGYRSAEGDDLNGALPKSQAAASVPQPGKKLVLRRGHRIKLMFGHKSWEAVYWGQDHKGPVVAHNTHRRWTLMHLDLDRFKETMVIEAEPEPKVIQEILQHLATKEDHE